MGLIGFLLVLWSPSGSYRDPVGLTVSQWVLQSPSRFYKIPMDLTRSLTKKKKYYENHFLTFTLISLFFFFTRTCRRCSWWLRAETFSCGVPTRTSTMLSPPSIYGSVLGPLSRGCFFREAYFYNVNNVWGVQERLEDCAKHVYVKVELWIF